MSEKIKLFTLSDHPLSPSGVANQTKYMIEHLLSTERYDVISFGGAISHDEYKPQKTDRWGDRWKIFPVDGYGDHDSVRALIHQAKPDILWFMTDPRFYGWLWEIENEIRQAVPMVYYHVWDNRPYPTFNKLFYESNDVIATISKVTDDIVKTVAPDVESIYLPHAVDPGIFKKASLGDVKRFRHESFPEEKDPEKMIFFWNNRNARRKQSGSLIFWFKEFLDIVGHENARLIMHTEPKDPHGQDLEAIIRELGLTSGQVLFSTQKFSPEILAMMYNMADCTINISDAEGFGLATLESLSCGTPIIVNMTGGLQEQVTDGEEWFGIGLEPSSKAIIGSQQVPFIYEDRLNGEDVVNALVEMYNMDKEKREEMGRKGTEHVKKNYGYQKYCDSWDELLTKVHEKYGSWENRKYKSWHFKEF